MTRRAISTTGAPAAIGPYSQGIVTDGLLFTAGQAALDPATGQLVEGGIEAETERVMANLTSVLDAAGCVWGDVVKTTIFLVDMADFARSTRSTAGSCLIRRRRARRSASPPSRKAPGSRSRPSPGFAIERRPPVDTPNEPPLRCADPLMTADPIAPGPDRFGSDVRSRTCARWRRSSREPPRSRSGDRHGRGRSWRPVSGRGCARRHPRCSIRCAGVRCLPMSWMRGPARPTAPPPARRSWSTRRRSRRSPEAFAGRAHLRPPGRAARHRRRGPGRPGRRARRCHRDPGPVRRRPAGHRRGPRRDPRGAPRRRRGHRAGQRLCRRAGPARAGRARRASERSSGSSRSGDATAEELVGNETNAGLYAFDAAWLRRRIERPRAVAGHRRGLPDRPRPARPRGWPDRQRRRVRGRRPLRRDQRSLAARGGRMEPARPPERGPHANGVSMRDPSTVYLDWTVDLGRRRDPRTQRDPARRDLGRRRQRDRARAASWSMRPSVARAQVWASIVESSTVEDGATVGPFSHLRPGSVVGAGAAVGNYAELKNTHLGAGFQAAPRELPRATPRSARASTSEPARSPPTTTGRASTGPRSARAPSSASTPCSSPRSRSARAPGPGPARS